MRQSAGQRRIANAVVHIKIGILPSSFGCASSGGVIHHRRRGRRGSLRLMPWRRGERRRWLALMPQEHRADRRARNGNSAGDIASENRRGVKWATFRHGGEVAAAGSKRGTNTALYETHYTKISLPEQYSAARPAAFRPPCPHHSVECRAAILIPVLNCRQPRVSLKA